MRVTSVLLCLALFAGSVPALAQTPAVPAISGPPSTPPAATATPKPTPGPVRDDWTEFMESYHAVQKIPRRQVVRTSEKYARPNAVTPFEMEIVGEDAEYFYLKNIPIEDPRSPAHGTWLRHENVEVQVDLLKELEQRVFILDPFAPIVPPPFTDRLAFEDRSAGLPTEGKWQIGFHHADFNGDGLEDLVFPPPRMGDGRPVIFLQTATGWSAWSAARWPATKLDYGDVGAADFDGDGNLDIAIACHFLRNYVLFGDGKGDFTRIVELPRINPAVTSRALTIGDLNGDRRPDIVFLAELDMQMGTNQAISSGLLTVCLNLGSGWRAVEATGGRRDVYGDQVAVGDFDADGDLDVLIASLKNANRHFVYLNNGQGTGWTAVGLKEFPYRAFVGAVAAADFDSAPGSEAVMGFHQRIESGSLTFNRDGIAIYSFGVGEDGLAFKDRRLLDMDAAEYADYTCADAGDIDGDGRTDIVLGRQDGRVRVFLQASDGSFLEERSAELVVGKAWVNSVRIVSLSPKGPRAIVVGASDGGRGGAAGSIHCFVVKGGKA